LFLVIPVIFRRDVLKEIKQEILDISDLTKQSLWYTVKYLFEPIDEYKDRVLRIEEESDKINLRIIDTVIGHLDKRCEKGRRLREFLMYMEISAIYERICDLLEKICKLGPSKGIDGDLKEKLVWMAKKVITMIELSENAMREEDVSELKTNLEKIDDEIDELFHECKSEIIRRLKEKGNEEVYGNILYVIGYLERIGDLAAKIGSRLVFIFEAKHVFIK